MFILYYTVSIKDYKSDLDIFLVILSRTIKFKMFSNQVLAIAQDSNVNLLSKGEIFAPENFPRHLILQDLSTFEDFLPSGQNSHMLQFSTVSSVSSPLVFLSPG